MAAYISVKGWIECADDDVKTIRETIDRFWDDDHFSLAEKESAELYKHGWIFPAHHFNWSSYIFFGACIKSPFIAFFEKCIELITKLNLEVSGYFEFDYYEEGYKTEWKRDKDNLVKISN